MAPASCNCNKCCTLTHNNQTLLCCRRVEPIALHVAHLHPVTPMGPKPVAMNPGSHPHLLSEEATAFSGHAWQLAALRIVLTALSPQEMQVLWTLLAEGAPEA
jgi:hypothetical protein